MTAKWLKVDIRWGQHLCGNENFERVVDAFGVLGATYYIEIYPGTPRGGAPSYIVQTCKHMEDARACKTTGVWGLLVIL